MLKKPLVVLAAVALSLSASVAFADEDEEPVPTSSRPPSSGVGYLVTGGIFTGIGGVNLLTAPICKTSVIRSDIQNTCLDASLVIAGIGLVVGIPLIVVGLNRRADYNAWKMQHPVAAGLSVAPARGGGTVGWTVDF